MNIVIIAGGLGTRANSESPKILQEINGKRLVDSYIDSFERIGEKERSFQVAFLLGHKSQQVENYVSNFLEISYIKPKHDYMFFTENERLGPAGAIWQARDFLDWSKETILILGDLYFQFNFDRLIDFSRNRDADICVVAHPNLHSFDSDVVKVKPESNQITAIDLKDFRHGEPVSSFAAAGIFFFKNLDIKSYKRPEQDQSVLEFLVVPKLKEFSRVFALITSEYIKDSGTPERRREIEDSIRLGSVGRRNFTSPKSAIFLDRDNTLLQDNSFFSVIEPPIANSISKANRHGIPIIVISNQPSVAKGKKSLEEVDHFHKSVDLFLEKFHALIDAWYWCPHHDEIGFEGEVRAFKVNCSCRKPQSGLLNFAAIDHNVTLKSSFLIGDSLADLKSAESVGVTFLHTRHFTHCSLSTNHLCFSRTDEALEFAQLEILDNDFF